MQALVSGIVGLAILILTIVYYKATKKYSQKYKEKTKLIAIIFIIINAISAILLQFLIKRISGAFIVGQIIGLFLNYIILKAQLRTAQSLADINWLRGSSFLKRNFNLKGIDWKLIFKTSLILLIWTIIIFEISNPQINPELIKDFKKDLRWLSILNTLLVIWILGPIREEITFRFLGVNLFLHWFGKGKFKKFISITIPSIVWMFLHSGVLINNWIKYIQVLPLGIACGYILYRKDIEHSILIHIIFNIFASIYSIILFI
ncbi:CPBP family intramembrane glutamic endopeptidase [Thermohalobacter berrensis]|uniref:CAAX prenyl protease 2/Lysostaphin resistance protein A-like domain-containing protein n=1 Tax=Thermohalobacter berrensis TaxID=99594 RepID=A0A419SU87_9FIRM|nr:CPBP family intramembrane glutamic endopeptidase [Thermohalobacter berrensis]RKD28765.1 hypothetical protein BET03_06925 [Thermohalobacter berrensis]